MLNDQNTRQQLMHQLALVRKALENYGIRDAADYAEVLIAEALSGQRVPNRINKGHDVIAVPFGRIEVKCRQLPRDGRVEERVAISESKKGGFDYLAILIFDVEFAIKGAVLLPYSAVWEIVMTQQFNRISYAEACRLPESVNITNAVRAAARDVIVPTGA